MSTDQFGGVALEDAPQTDDFGGVAVSEKKRDNFGGIPVSSDEFGGIPIGYKRPVSLKLTPYEQAEIEAHLAGQPSPASYMGQSAGSAIRGEPQDYEFTLGLQNLYDRLSQPLIKPAPPKDLEEQRKKHPVAVGITRGVVDLAEGFSSPIGIATLGMGALPRTAQRAISLAFAAQMASQTPDIARELGTEFGNPEGQRDEFKIAKLITDAGGSTVMTALAGAHGLASERPLPTPGSPAAAAESSAPVPPVEPTPEPTVAPPQPVPESKPGLVSMEDAFQKALQKVSTPNIEDIRPAVRTMDNQVLVGDKGQVHDDIIAKHDLKAEDIDSRIFVDQDGTEISRAQLAAMGVAETKAVPGAHADELSRRQTDPLNLETPPPSSQAPVENVAVKPSESEISGQKETPEQIKSKTITQRIRAGIQPEDLRITVQPTQVDPDSGNPIPGTGYVQVDEVHPKLGNTFSSNPEDMNRRGFKMPTSEELSKLPAGRYTLPEAIDALAKQQGGGAAELGEVGSPTGQDVYGIAARVRKERASAGQVADIKPGEGITAPDSVERGKELLSSGSNPEEAMSYFENTKRFSSDDMALVRAQGEQLASNARTSEEQFGTDSKEYRTAWKKLSDWDARSKAMQTEWHREGQAQQGETDIDTGSFTGLRQAYQQDTGKDFTPEQAGTAKKIAKRVKGASDSTDTARETLNHHLRETHDIADAEQNALDAASKTVREAAVRRAEAENKQRVADAALKRTVAKVQEDAAAKAKAAADKTVRNAAVKQAEAENKARVKVAKLAKEAADVQVKAAKTAEDAANRRAREAAMRTAEEARKDQADPARAVWRKVKQYLDAGEDDFDDIRNKVATDLGMKVEKVTYLINQTKRTKFLSDDLWQKQQQLRRFRQQAKRWLTQTQIPLYTKAIQQVPRVLFGLKVGFHGTVALGTHAPMVAFQPRFWKTYFQNFVKMYRMVGSRAYYEMQAQDLLRRPNYITARRAGLINDPFQYEDYNSPDVAQYVGGLSGAGTRGYSVLKILRQDMFDQYWNNLPKTARIPQIAGAIADGINHATGTTTTSLPPKWKGNPLVKVVTSPVTFFAPKLMGSRIEWLTTDPAKSVGTFLNWKNASLGDREFAINQVKEKAWVAGTLFGLLALNQGILSATDSKQKVNFSDPMKGDFLKFKAAGMDISYGNPMITMARLPIRLYSIRESNGGKLRNLIYPDEDTYTVLGEYGRSQMSPFASLITDLWMKSDWMRRSLPNSNRPMPKRLRAQGIQPYTWTEFWSEEVLPIPAEEALKEVWKNGLGMSPEQISQMKKAMATIAVMSATGARLSDDYEVKKDDPLKIAKP